MSTDFPLLAPLKSEADRLGVALDTTALGRFSHYLEVLGLWRERAGLTSLDEPDEQQRRLFAESLALLRVLRDRAILPDTGLPDIDLPDAGAEPVDIVDIGAGAGFPGVPMRIVEPQLRLTLIESHGRRAEFLEQLVEELGLSDVRVVRARAEEAGRDPSLRATFDLAVARAVAPLPVLVEYALPLLRDGGVLATPKGSRAQAELAEAAGAIAALGGVAEEPVDLPLPAEAPPQSVLFVRRAGPLDERYPRRPGMPSKRPLR